MRFISGIVGLLVAITCPAGAEQAYRATYDGNHQMTAYTDVKTGITLKISKDRHQITAVDPKGNQLWTRADYFEQEFIVPGRRREAPPPVVVWKFEPLPGGKAGEVIQSEARRHGLRGPLLLVRHSDSCCGGGAVGPISEIDGEMRTETN